MMNAAMRFSDQPALTVLLNAVPNKSILFELLSLEDDELIELSEGGIASGLRLDDIVNMNVKQLRTALHGLDKTCQSAPMPGIPLDLAQKASEFLHQVKAGVYAAKILLESPDSDFESQGFKKDCLFYQIDNTHKLIKHYEALFNDAVAGNPP